LQAAEAAAAASRAEAAALEAELEKAADQLAAPTPPSVGGVVRNTAQVERELDEAMTDLAAAEATAERLRDELHKAQSHARRTAEELQAERVLAAASGTVTFAGMRGALGNYVEVLHADGLVTKYGHNSALFTHSSIWSSNSEVAEVRLTVVTYSALIGTNKTGGAA
jgi:murein DD-endopeptidase MepM/ murein hydrolase activator NlpD